MRRRCLRPNAAAVVLALTGAAPSYAADARTAWWVDTRPWSCASWAAPLARQIQLACDAGGQCAIASDERLAARHATLFCASDERWTLEARDRSGRLLWSLALEGEPDDRLRQAGVWIARSEASDQPVPATAVPEATPSPSPSPAPSPAPTPSDADQAEAPREPDPRSDSRDGWLALSAGGYVGQLTLYDVPQVDNETPTGSGTAAMAGLHAVATAHLQRAYAGLSVVYEQSLTNFHTIGVVLWRPGLTLGWGAPYGGGLLGFSVTGGVLYSDTAQSIPVTPGVNNLQPVQYRQDWNQMQYFGEIAGYVRLPRVAGQQPFVSPSAAWVAKSSLYAPKSMFGIELGVVWND
jgi:hypothetical protein